MWCVCIYVDADRLRHAIKSINNGLADLLCSPFVLRSTGQPTSSGREGVENLLKPRKVKRESNYASRL